MIVNKALFVQQCSGDVFDKIIGDT